MYKQTFLLSVLALSACVAEQDHIQQTDGSNATIASALVRETPQETIKLNDAVALDFINAMADDRELSSVIYPAFKYKPKQQCFDLWYSEDAFTPRTEITNQCYLWTKELAWLYGTYGYEVVPRAFASKRFWAHIDAFDRDAANARDKKKNTDWTCTRAPQTGYTTPEIIPLSQKDRSCPDIVTTK